MLRDPSHGQEPHGASPIPGETPCEAPSGGCREAPSASVPPPDPRDGEATILVVDDLADVRYVTRLALEMAGYAVLDACGGQEALETLDEVEAGGGHVDLVLTDVMMPGMDGTALAWAVRASRPEVPILFVSAHRAYQPPLGPQGPLGHFLPKPYRPSEVVKAVEESLAAGVASTTPPA